MQGPRQAAAGGRRLACPAPPRPRPASLHGITLCTSTLRCTRTLRAHTIPRSASSLRGRSAAAPRAARCAVAAPFLAPHRSGCPPIPPVRPGGRRKAPGHWGRAPRGSCLPRRLRPLSDQIRSDRPALPSQSPQHCGGPPRQASWRRAPPASLGAPRPRLGARGGSRASLFRRPPSRAPGSQNPLAFPFPLNVPETNGAPRPASSARAPRRAALVYSTRVSVGGAGRRDSAAQGAARRASCHRPSPRAWKRPPTRPKTRGSAAASLAPLRPAERPRASRARPALPPPPSLSSPTQACTVWSPSSLTAAEAPRNHLCRRARAVAPLPAPRPNARQRPAAAPRLLPGMHRLLLRRSALCGAVGRALPAHVNVRREARHFFPFFPTHTE